MGLVELLLLSLSLGMDTFAVSICKGLSMKRLDMKKGIIMGLYFSFFHFFMLIIGYTLGTSFEKFITSIDHWIAFLLLLIIGFNMVREGLSNNKENFNDRVDFKTMFPLSLATSIDALVVGITFAFLNVNVCFAMLLIAVVVFIMAVIAVRIGNRFGRKYENKAQVFGGIILILLGVKVLLEHLKIL